MFLQFLQICRQIGRISTVEELLSGLIEKSQGKPTLVPMSDKCPAMKNTTINGFKEDN